MAKKVFNFKGELQENGDKVITDISDCKGTLPVKGGGTGATDAATARTNLGIGASGTHADNYYSLSTHTHNYAGSSSVGGAATTALTCTGNAATATTASKLGSSTVGGTTSPIYLNSGAASQCTGRTVPGIKSLSAINSIGYGTNNSYVPDITALAYWNGAHSGTSSNLAYCNKGAFGDMATKTASNYSLSTHTHNYAGSSSAGGNANYSEYLTVHNLGSNYSMTATDFKNPGIYFIDSLASANAPDNDTGDYRILVTSTSDAYQTLIMTSPRSDYLYIGHFWDSVFQGWRRLMTIDGNGNTYLPEALVFRGSDTTYPLMCAYKSTYGQIMFFPRGWNTSEALTAGIAIGNTNSDSYEFRSRNDNTYNLGTSSFRWKQLYASTTTISTSDRNKKYDIEELREDSIKNFIMGLKPSSFKFKDGESGRIHYGMIAQDVEDLMNELDMSSLDFAGFIKSEKQKLKDESKPDSGYEVVPNEYEYGLRYEEFIAPLIKMVQIQQKKIEELENDILELKSKL